MLTLVEMESASAPVHRMLPPTPPFEWPLLSQRAGCEVWVKQETHPPVGAIALAGLLSERERPAGGRAGLVLTGGKVDRESFEAILAGQTPPP